MRDRLVRVAGLSIALVLPQQLSSSNRSPERVEEWVTNGPWGGDVRALAADPSHPGALYAGTTRGVFRSSDGGRTWSETSPFLPVSDIVETVAVSASVPQRIFIGTYYNGLFRSLDGGQSWESVAPEIFGSAHGQVMPLVADPSDGNKIWAAVGHNQLFQSVDGGDTWAPSSLPNGVPIALAIAPSNSAVVYAGGYFLNGQTNPPNGVCVSTDGGTSWTGTPLSVFGGEIGSLVVDPTNPSIAFAAGEGGIYKTTDTGATWTLSAPTSIAYETRTLAVDWFDSNVVYANGNAGIVVSTDGGVNWTTIAPDASNPADRIFPVLLTDPFSANVAYLGQSNGLFRTEDRGSTWNLSSTGIDDVAVSSLDLGLSGQDVLLGSSVGLLFRSTDPNAGWIQEYGIIAYAVASDPADPAIRYTASSAISKSVDGGLTWTQKYETFPDLIALAVDPRDSDYVFAGRSVVPFTHGVLVGGGVVWSSDRGETWNEPTQLLLENVMSVAVSAGDGSVLASTLTGLRRSVDHALTWSQDLLPGLGVRDIRFAPADSQIVYAATSSGVYRSADGGAGWVPAGLAGVSVTSAAVDPVDTATVYAGGDGPSISVTHDSGQTWSAVSVRGIRGSTVTTLAIEMNGSGLVISTDRGVFAPRSRRVRSVGPR